jgi:hypothetical protein
MRRTRKIVARRRKTLRRKNRQMKKRKQRGGADHKADIIQLITSRNNWPEIMEFFTDIDAPVWHPAYPKKAGDHYYLLIEDGGFDDDSVHKLILFDFKMTEDAFTEVEIHISEDKTPRSVAAQLPAETEEYTEYANDIYKGIRDASRELFNVGA